MPPKGHAILSASSSRRWLNCPPSARLCEKYADVVTDYTTEGTDAHTLCEYKLRKALGMKTSDPTENLTWYNEEMEDCATAYATYVLEFLEDAKQNCTDPVVMVEQRVDFSRWVQNGFGTADCIIIADGTFVRHAARTDCSTKSACSMFRRTCLCLWARQRTRRHGIPRAATLTARMFRQRL